MVVGWARPFAALTAEGVQTTATYLLRHVHPPVALALTKGGPQARLNARHVLLVYGFKKHEREALKLALSMAADPEARVEILVARQPGDEPLEGATLDGVDNGFGGSNVGEPPKGEGVDNTIDGYDVNVDTTSASRRMWYEYLDVVVLSYHWGSNYNWRPPKEFQRLAHRYNAQPSRLSVLRCSAHP